MAYTSSDLMKRSNSFTKHEWNGHMTNTATVTAMTSYADFAAYANARPQAASFFARFAKLTSVMRQRRALARLDAHLLEDIGVTARQASTEAHRLF